MVTPAQRMALMKAQAGQRPPQQLAIEFSNRAGIFYSGQKLEGTVIFATREKFEASGVRVKLRGVAVTRWDGGKAGDQLCTTEELIFEHKATCWGNEEGSSAPDVSFAPGQHRFPFFFRIPDSCPTSFEWAGGGVVRYVCTALLDRKGAQPLKKLRPVNVIGIHDLNKDSEAGLVSHKDDEAVFQSLCSTKRLVMRTRCPRRGIMPGEVVPVSLDVENSSKLTVKAMKMRIRQRIVMYAKNTVTGAREQREFIRNRGEVAWTGSPIRPGGRDSWKVDIIVPVMPPKLINCRLIESHYRMECEMTVDDKPGTIVTHVPLVIGTIPLRSEFGKLVGGSASSVGVPIPSGDYPDMPLPSFLPAEDIVGKLDSGERILPLYPAYKTKGNAGPSNIPTTNEAAW